jgi:hypothetical protein
MAKRMKLIPEGLYKKIMDNFNKDNREEQLRKSKEDVLSEDLPDDVKVMLYHDLSRQLQHKLLDSENKPILVKQATEKTMLAKPPEVSSLNTQTPTTSTPNTTTSTILQTPNVASGSTKSTIPFSAPTFNASHRYDTPVQAETSNQKASKLALWEFMERNGLQWDKGTDEVTIDGSKLHGSSLTKLLATLTSGRYSVRKAEGYADVHEWLMRKNVPKDLLALNRRFLFTPPMQTRSKDLTYESAHARKNWQTIG